MTKPTWTRDRITHQVGGGPWTRCGLEVPYIVVDKRAKRVRRRVAKDKRPRQVTCIDCLAASEQPMRVDLTDAFRGETAYMSWYDEKQGLTE